MANVKHYHRGSVKEILAHNERTNNYSNPDINPAKSKYNYSLSGHENDLAYYEERLSQVHCMKRANVNTLSSWVVTLPKGVKHGDHRKFFEETVEFLKNRYGAENCVGADVHFDETTPHVHFTFIPVVHDAKKNIDKVSRKELFTLKEMFSFHADLEKHIEEKLGYKVEIRTGKTEKNLSVRELKQQTKEECENLIKEASDKKENANKEASKIIADAQKRKCEIETDCNKEYYRIIDKANADKAEIEEWFAETGRVMREYAEIEKTLSDTLSIPDGKTIFGKVVIPKKVWDNMVAIVIKKEAIDKTFQALEKRAREFQLDMMSKEEKEREMDELKRSNAYLRQQVKDLTEKNREYRTQLEVQNGITKQEQKRWRGR